MDGFDLGKAAEWARKVAQKLEKKGRLLLIAGIFRPSGHVCSLACFPRGLVKLSGSPTCGCEIWGVHVGKVMGDVQ